MDDLIDHKIVKYKLKLYYNKDIDKIDIYNKKLDYYQNMKGSAKSINNLLSLFKKNKPIKVTKNDKSDILKNIISKTINEINDVYKYTNDNLKKILYSYKG